MKSLFISGALVVGCSLRAFMICNLLLDICGHVCREWHVLCQKHVLKALKRSIMKHQQTISKKMHEKARKQTKTTCTRRNNNSQTTVLNHQRINNKKQQSINHKRYEIHVNNRTFSSRNMRQERFAPAPQKNDNCKTQQIDHSSAVCCFSAIKGKEGRTFDCL